MRAHSFEEKGSSGMALAAPAASAAKPFYTLKKAADYLKSSPSRLFWRRIIILRHYVSRARFARPSGEFVTLIFLILYMPILALIPRIS